MAFRGLDFLQIDRMLSEEERMIRDETRAFVDREIVPLIEGHFEAHTFPDDLMKVLGEQGYLGSFLPEEYGGSGASYVAYGLVCQELERGDSGIRSFCSVQSSLVMLPIWKFGSEEQRQRWLPAMAQGQKIGCFGLTEPDFGSNPNGMLSRAKKDGESYILNGTKRWITNADIADVCLVWAKDDQGKVGAFLIEKGTPGLEQVEIKRKYSLRASHTGELIMEDCRIPASNRLPDAHGLKAALQCLDSARYGIGWGALGAAMACYEVALDYTKERVQFSRPIAGYQLVQDKLVWMLTEISKGQLLSLHIGRLRDQGFGHHSHVSMGKMNNVRIAIEIARMARELLGASGITAEYPIMRHMLNLESVLTYEGTENIHKLILGKEITGLAAFDG
ncbi:MAG: acyl-CoA dehydrogenase family protein [Myxococcales bacterium]|nr:acyl-CoA dehydrogenase family protein [Myxococcales bacterium]MCB9641691.1 acyl-CoA dehydrogenase family protein [Myxococcales bacterium]